MFHKNVDDRVFDFGWLLLTGLKDWCTVIVKSLEIKDE